MAILDFGGKHGGEILMSTHFFRIALWCKLIGICGSNSLTSIPDSNYASSGDDWTDERFGFHALSVARKSASNA